MYFSEHHSFSLLDLSIKSQRNKYLSVERNDSGKAITPMHARIKTFLDNALSQSGVLIYDMLFKMTIDLKTGFYVAAKQECASNKNLIKSMKSMKVWSDSEEPNYTIIPFEYPEYMKKRLHGLLASKIPIDEESLSNVLAKHKASYNKVYIFDKGKGHLKFKLESAFPFPNKLHIRNKTRKQYVLRKHTHAKTLKNRTRYNQNNIINDINNE